MVKAEINKGAGTLKELYDQTVPLTDFFEGPFAHKVEYAGGKGSNLAELNSVEGIKVPPGFMVLAPLSELILKQNPQIVEKIKELDEYSVSWVKAKLNESEEEAQSLEKAYSEKGAIIEKEMNSVKISQDERKKIVESYDELSRRVGIKNVRVAVRSSGICEDGSEFSFAGQNKTELHQEGEEEVINAVRSCIASQFGGRAIQYRNDARLTLTKRALEKEKDLDNALASNENFSHTESRLAVVVQEMIDSDASAIGFSVDSVTGADITRIDYNLGIGEALVGGDVTPDSYEVDPRTDKIIYRSIGEKENKTVYVKGGTQLVEVPLEQRNRPAVVDDIVIDTAKQIHLAKAHYLKKFNNKKIDMEFAVKNGVVYVTQARPETISSAKDPMIIEMREFTVTKEAKKGAKIAMKSGRMGSPGAATGIPMFAQNIEEAEKFLDAEENKGKNIILITNKTSPDWVKIMKRVKGIITRVGGDKCHAAIVSREQRVPCIVGAGSAIENLKNRKEITMDARNTMVYEGKLALEETGEDIDVREFLKNPTKTVLGIILANPDEAKRLHALSELGNKFKVSLLRAEFILGDIGAHINTLVDYNEKFKDINPIRVQEQALVDFDQGRLSKDLAEKVAKLLLENGYVSAKEYFIEKYSEGISRFAAIFPNSEIVLRTTDYKTNEYAELIGGKEYEEHEENPMMGKRGLERFLDPANREGFKWELEAIKRARDNGYKNIEIMFPMVRDPLEISGTPEEMEKKYKEGFRSVVDLMKEVGLEKGKDGLKVLMMVENPENVIMLDEYKKAGIDDISIGSNDLTQFTLGVDRDNEYLAGISQYTEMNPAVIRLVIQALRTCKEKDIISGLCGQAAGNYPEFAEMLVDEGIDSMGVPPDRLLATHRIIVEKESKKRSEGTVVYEAPTDVGGNDYGKLHN